MLKEPGYTKNVSFKRFYSHYVMGRNLRKYLSNRKKPDVIYCAVPSLDVAKTAAKYAKNIIFGLLLMFKIYGQRHLKWYLISQ